MKTKESIEKEYVILVHSISRLFNTHTSVNHINELLEQAKTARQNELRQLGGK